MKLYARIEGDLGEMPASKLPEILKTLTIKDNGAVVRMKDDAEYYNVVVGINVANQKTLAGAQLVGGIVTVWKASAWFVDGDGWRATLHSETVQLGQPKMPPPGPRIVPGRS